MRIVFTGGGTGGHVFPNIAVINEVRRLSTKGRAVSVFYIGEKGGPEERLVRADGIDFYGIHAGKLRRYFDFKNFLDFWLVPVGFAEAFLILRRLRPDLVFAKGGYVSVPVVLAARALGIPVWLHESDASPGLANRICGRFAERIFVAFSETLLSLRGAMSRSNPARNFEAVGNPIRPEILCGSAKKGRELTGFSSDLPVVLVMGGSLGAQSLNELMYAILPELIKKAQVVHITGAPAAHSGAFVIASTSACLPAGRKQSRFNSRNYRSFPFLGSELADIYAITDLTVSRAGSGAIFELLAAKIPMLLVPLPKSASRGDQIENAEIFEKHGWAEVYNQDAPSPAAFFAQISRLLDDKKVRARMSKSQSAADFSHAAEKIAKEMLKISEDRP